MLSGIIKLFYTEIVKENIKNMPNQEYELRKEAKKIQAIASKIDSFMFFVLKMTLLAVIFLFAYRFNRYLGTFIFVLELVYIFYIDKIKYSLSINIKRAKDNIETKKLIDKKLIKNLYIFIVLVFLGFIMDFNWSIVLSLVVVGVFTLIEFFKLSN